MTSHQNLRKIVKILVEYHPEYGNDWLSKTAIQNKMVEQDVGCSKKKHIEEGLDFLHELNVVEKTTREAKHSNLPGVDEFKAWRIKGRPSDIDIDL